MSAKRKLLSLLELIKASDALDARKESGLPAVLRPRAVSKASPAGGSPASRPFCRMGKERY
jgi:hypothetical protein